MSEVQAIDVVEQVETAHGLLRLERYVSEGKNHHALWINDERMMADEGFDSELALAHIADGLWRVPQGVEGANDSEGSGRPRGRNVLVGGLGVGYTARAALELPDVERVVVLELQPRVVDWARGVFREANGGVVDDPRVEIVISDLARYLAEPPDGDRFDLCLLDVDNSPERFLVASNESLYQSDGLQQLVSCLSPGGVAVCWSLAPVDSLLTRVATLDAPVALYGSYTYDLKEGCSPRYFGYVGRSLFL
jgi:hypothetical protein